MGRYKKSKPVREIEVSITINPERIGLFLLSRAKQEDPSEKKYRGKTNFLKPDS